MTAALATLKLADFAAECRQRTDDTLQQLLSNIDTPAATLQQAMHYSVFNGGKRVRPILVYAAALCAGQRTPLTDICAASVELIHAYSLVHDDLPAMDDDDLRRGQPTCHIAFDEASAILAGDALQTLAFECLSTVELAEPALQLKLLQELTRAAGARGMVGGQAIDLASVEQALSLHDLQTMHRLKTGALISASVRMGALSTGLTDSHTLQTLSRYADAIGLAFQVQDDILDVTADTHTLGKTQGADSALNKPTYVALLGLEGAQQKALQLLDEALEAIDSLNPNTDYLAQLAHYIVERRY